jgi:hypothetical protein
MKIKILGVLINVIFNFSLNENSIKDNSNNNTEDIKIIVSIGFFIKDLIKSNIKTPLIMKYWIKLIIVLDTL